VYSDIAGGKALSEENSKALVDATNTFKEGFTASDGSRVVNEADADALESDEVDHEKVTVKKKNTSK